MSGKVRRAKDRIDLTRLLQALANPTTRRLIEMLAVAPLTHEDLMLQFDLTVRATEHAASILREVGLLRIKEKKAASEYHLDERGLALVRSWLDSVENLGRSSQPAH